ncbi:uncharacterized protein N7518_002428 [Penicillium psychrosexuale]|uniref:uncharacterized protein n=1 Tax=Penicillium psychrosexuale TaxID=1002107 RepID=UPI00254510D4|nr:uncharacterized protein N7518_002428 [Penicillium psychrosexuale]KAJ5800360.1 hypothetical protein N7518_002428 [Penicillium psychrosexuale]
MPRLRLQPQLPERALIGGSQIMLIHPLPDDWWTTPAKTGIRGIGPRAHKIPKPKKAKRGNCEVPRIRKPCSGEKRVG